MAPNTVSITPGNSQTSVLTVTSTTPHVGIGGPQRSLLYRTGGAVFALLVCLLPFGRRFIRPLMAALFLLGALTALSCCTIGSGSTSPVLHGSEGTYKVTVTGTSGTTTANTTIPLTVN